MVHRRTVPSGIQVPSEQAAQAVYLIYRSSFAAEAEGRS